MRGYKFKVPELVATIGNLDQMLTTSEIKYKRFESSTGVLKKDGTLGFEKEMKKKIDGILCEWWEKQVVDGKIIGSILRDRIFHTGVLVPWDIAQKGPAESHRWLKKVKEDYSSSLSNIDNSEQKEE